MIVLILCLAVGVGVAVFSRNAVEPTGVAYSRDAMPLMPSGLFPTIAALAFDSCDVCRSVRMRRDGYVLTATLIVPRRYDARDALEVVDRRIRVALPKCHVNVRAAYE